MSNEIQLENDTRIIKRAVAKGKDGKAALRRNV